MGTNHVHGLPSLLARDSACMKFQSPLGSGCADLRRRLHSPTDSASRPILGRSPQQAWDTTKVESAASWLIDTNPLGARGQHHKPATRGSSLSPGRRRRGVGYEDMFQEHVREVAGGSSDMRASICGRRDGVDPPRLGPSSSRALNFASRLPTTF